MISSNTSIYTSYEVPLSVLIETIAFENDKIVVDVNNTLLGNNIQLEVDMVVLAVGMTPNNTEDLNLKYRLGNRFEGGDPL